MTNQEVVDYINNLKNEETSIALDIEMANDLLNAREEISKLKGIIWLIQRCAEARIDACRPNRIISIFMYRYNEDKLLECNAYDNIILIDKIVRDDTGEILIKNI